MADQKLLTINKQTGKISSTRRPRKLCGKDPFTNTFKFIERSYKVSQLPWKLCGLKMYTYTYMIAYTSHARHPNYQPPDNKPIYPFSGINTSPSTFLDNHSEYRLHPPRRVLHKHGPGLVRRGLGTHRRLGVRVVLPRLVVRTTVLASQPFPRGSGSRGPRGSLPSRIGLFSRRACASWDFSQGSEAGSTGSSGPRGGLSSRVRLPYVCPSRTVFSSM